jgi:hypothetical protein
VQRVCYVPIAVLLTRISDKPVFGQYAFAAPNGATLRVGDTVRVTERAPDGPKTPVVKAETPAGVEVEMVG